MTQLVHLETANRVATLTIDRPKALNALNRQVLEEIGQAVDAIPADAQILVLAGSGEKAFVAGADIAEMVDLCPQDAEAFSRFGQAVFQKISDLPIPVLSKIQGFALGGGLELALSADVLIASSKAKVGLPETTLGVVPGFAGTQRLTQRVGIGNANRLLFSGEIIGAQEAQAMGLLQIVVEPDALDERVQSYCDALLRNGPLAIQACKQLAKHAVQPLEKGSNAEAEAFGHMFATKDRREGMQAFLEKRKPTFVGA